MFIGDLGSVCRSAEVHSAASQNFILRGGGRFGALTDISSSADYKSAIRQMANLRCVSDARIHLASSFVAA
jgi:hypothetical protein